MTIGLNKSILESQLLKFDIITTTYCGISGEELYRIIEVISLVHVCKKDKGMKSGEEREMK